jgi:hypothetical protein
MRLDQLSKELSDQFTTIFLKNNATKSFTEAKEYTIECDVDVKITALVKMHFVYYDNHSDGGCGCSHSYTADILVTPSNVQVENAVKTYFDSQKKHTWQNSVVHTFHDVKINSEVVKFTLN